MFSTNHNQSKKKLPLTKLGQSKTIPQRWDTYQNSLIVSDLVSAHKDVIRIGTRIFKSDKFWSQKHWQQPIIPTQWRRVNSWLAHIEHCQIRSVQNGENYPTISDHFAITKLLCTRCRNAVLDKKSFLNSKETPTQTTNSYHNKQFNIW